jgi:hypothetical protein
MNFNDEMTLTWRDFYRIPVMVALMLPVAAAFVVGFVFGLIGDAVEEGMEAAIGFGE